MATGTRDYGIVGTTSTSTGTDSGTAPNPGVHASTNSIFFHSIAGDKNWSTSMVVRSNPKDNPLFKEIN